MMVELIDDFFAPNIRRQLASQTRLTPTKSLRRLQRLWQN